MRLASGFVIGVLAGLPEVFLLILYGPSLYWGLGRPERHDDAGKGIA